MEWESCTTDWTGLGVHGKARRRFNGVYRFFSSSFYCFFLSGFTLTGLVQYSELEGGDSIIWGRAQWRKLSLISKFTNGWSEEGARPLFSGRRCLWVCGYGGHGGYGGFWLRNLWPWAWWDPWQMGRRFWVVEVGCGWFVSNRWFEEGDRFRGRKCMLVYGYGGSLDAMRYFAVGLPWVWSRRSW